MKVIKKVSDGWVKTIDKPDRLEGMLCMAPGGCGGCGGFLCSLGCGSPTFGPCV